jgi:hypothetical protein
MMGGVVDRHIPLDGSSTYGMKTYKDLRVLQNDIVGLQIMTQAQEQSATQRQRVRIVKVLEINPKERKIKLEDVRGRSVSSAYASIGNDLAMRAEFKKVFGQTLQALDLAITEHLSHIIGTGKIRNYTHKVSSFQHTLPMLIVDFEVLRTDGTYKKIHIMVKDDNVLLEANTGQFVIIDPY